MYWAYLYAVAAWFTACSVASNRTCIEALLPQPPYLRLLGMMVVSLIWPVLVAYGLYGFAKGMYAAREL